jgi:HEPN domain-containing protein
MTNRVRARDLLWFTREVLEEMRRHRARGVWNGVVRRGQEVVENSLKALLLYLGAEYPRIHDPAPVL